MYHFNLEQGFIAVVEKILGLATVYANNAEEQLAAETQSHDFDLLTHNGAYTAFIRRYLSK